MSILVLTLYLPVSFAQDSPQWHLPNDAKTRFGKGIINEIQYSPDGTRLAVASGIGIWLYDAQTGEELDLLTGHSRVVTSIAFSPDGQTLVSGSRDHTIRIWDASTGDHLRILTGHTYWVYSVAFSPNGQTLASGSSSIDGICIWDVSTGTHLRTFAGHTSIVSSISFSPDGNTLASGSWDHTIRIWDASTGDHLHTLTGHTGLVNTVAFSPDGNKLASGSWDNTIRIWDAGTGTHLRTLTEHTDSVFSVSFSPDGNKFASGSDDNTIRIWDVSTGRLLRPFTGHIGSIRSVVFSPDGQTLASGSHDGTIRMWNASTGKPVRTFTGHTNSIWSVAFSPYGNTIASGSFGVGIRMWNASTGKPVRTTFTGHTSPVRSIAFSPDGNAVVSGSNDGSLHLWDVSTGRLRRTFTGHTNSILSIAFSPDGNTIASASADETIRIWDAGTSEHIHTLTGHTDFVWSVAFSPSGQTLASGSWDSTVRIWDTSTGKHIRTLTGHTDFVISVAFNPDGQTLASGSQDKTVRIWDANTGRHLRTLTGHTGSAESVAFSPDGQTLASGGESKILLWEANTESHFHTLTGHASWILSLSFSPDGSTLISGSSDGTVLLWDLTSIINSNAIVSFFPSPAQSPSIGEQLTLDLNITNGKTVAGYQATVHFDTSVLRYVESANGDYLSSNAFFVPPVVSKNKVTLGATSFGEINSGNGTLATLTFEALDVKASALVISDLILTDHDGEHLPVVGLRGWMVEPTALPSSAVVSIKPSSVLSPAVGERLTFNVEITSGQSVADYQLTFDYDLSVLEFISTTRGNYLAAGAGNGGGTLETVTFRVRDVKASTISVSGHLIATNGLRYLPTFESAEVVAPIFGDVNRDGSVNILDLVVVASKFGQRISGDPADVNEDGVVNIVDLVKVAGALGGDAAAPSVWDLRPEIIPTRADVQNWLSQARQLNLTDTTSQRGIRFLEQLLAALTPKETALLANYPNPFNPETWIPYQLAAPADVTVTIYAVDGTVVRTLTLGHQPIGIYESRSRAAYWDGRNAQGEPVASGVYFYTLKAGEFTATRKMLIRK